MPEAHRGPAMRQQKAGIIFTVAVYNLPGGTRRMVHLGWIAEDFTIISTGKNLRNGGQAEELALDAGGGPASLGRTTATMSISPDFDRKPTSSGPDEWCRRTHQSLACRS